MTVEVARRLVIALMFVAVAGVLSGTNGSDAWAPLGWGLALLSSTAALVVLVSARRPSGRDR